MAWFYQPLTPASASLLAGAGSQALTPSLFTSATVVFFAATVAAGAVTLTPGLFSNANAFYAPTVAPGAVDLTPALVTNSNTFYVPTVSAGAVDLTPGLFSSATNTFYAATVSSLPVVEQHGGGGRRKRTLHRQPYQIDAHQSFMAEIEQSRERAAKIGISAKAAKVIESVAKRQAEDSRQDQHQRYEELQRELDAQDIEWQAGYLELMNDLRDALISAEIKQRMEKIRQTKDEEIMLMMIAAIL